MGLFREFVVLDTETTGYPPGCRLVEIGALKVRGRNVVDRFSSLVFPEAPIPPAVVRIHGIDDEAVREAPSAKEVLPEFLAWCGALPLLAHNAAFDAAVIGAECARIGVRPGENRVFCTLRASRRLWKGPDHSLEGLVRDLGLREGLHHRALEDAGHALHLFWKLAELEEAPRTAPLGGFLGPGRLLTDFLPVPPRLPASKRILEEAAAAGEAVRIHYLRPDGRLVPLQVSPRFFFRAGKSVRMEAFCHLAGFFKHYRLDRILAAHPCPEDPRPLPG
ncbi:MAG: exonuclease domain-containing protein [Planctomycetota bacterium]